MNKKGYSLMNSLLAVLLAACFSASTTGGQFLSLAQDKSAKVEDQDIIYSDSEVDVKAAILNLKDINPARSGGHARDCKGTVEVKLTMVLRKSGKVSDVKIVESARCSLDVNAIRSTRKIKFKPAEKGGVAVSQASEISFTQTIVR